MASRDDDDDADSAAGLEVAVGVVHQNRQHLPARLGRQVAHDVVVQGARFDPVKAVAEAGGRVRQVVDRRVVVGVVDGDVERVLRDPLRLRRDPDPPVVQRAHGDLEPHAFLLIPL